MVEDGCCTGLRNAGQAAPATLSLGGGVGRWAGGAATQGGRCLRQGGTCGLLGALPTCLASPPRGGRRQHGACSSHAAASLATTAASTCWCDENTLSMLGILAAETRGAAGDVILCACKAPHLSQLRAFPLASSLSLLFRRASKLLAALHAWLVSAARAVLAAFSAGDACVDAAWAAHGRSLLGACGSRSSASASACGIPRQQKVRHLVKWLLCILTRTLFLQRSLVVPEGGRAVGVVWAAWRRRGAADEGRAAGGRHQALPARPAASRSSPYQARTCLVSFMFHAGTVSRGLFSSHDILVISAGAVLSPGAIWRVGDMALSYRYLIAAFSGEIASRCINLALYPSRDALCLSISATILFSPVSCSLSSAR